MPESAAPYLRHIVVFNFLLVSALLIALGKIVTARPLKELPKGRQNAAEYLLEWFVDQARSIHPGRVTLIVPFLGTLFLLILCSNLMTLVPVPVLRFPPTAYYSGPLALALVAVLGGIVIAARIEGSARDPRSTCSGPIHSSSWVT